MQSKFRQRIAIIFSFSLRLDCGKRFIWITTIGAKSATAKRQLGEMVECVCGESGGIPACVM